MSTWVIAGCGPSLTKSDIEYAQQNGAHIVLTNNAYTLIPNSDVLVACDLAWWRNHPQALLHKSRKFCHKPMFNNRVEHYVPDSFPKAGNTGLYGMFAARDLGAKKIILLGFDMHGSHFFGNHPEPLKNPQQSTFDMHLKQFKNFHGASVVNCTQDSALKDYPFSTLQKEI